MSYVDFYAYSRLGSEDQAPYIDDFLHDGVRSSCQPDALFEVWTERKPRPIEEKFTRDEACEA